MRNWVFSPTSYLRVPMGWEVVRNGNFVQIYLTLLTGGGLCLFLPPPNQEDMFVNLG